MAIAARIPMIATTIISSMRVKPRWLRKFRRRAVQKRSIDVLLECSTFVLGCCHTRPAQDGGALAYTDNEREYGGARDSESRTVVRASRCESSGMSAAWQASSAAGAMGSAASSTKTSRLMI